jgi:uncharacterized protein YcsI (UPF0317 family)
MAFPEEARMAVAQLNPAINDYADPRAARRAIRAGRHSSHTARMAPGYVQGNLCILPADWAAEFHRFCTLNPKPCPVLAIGNPGDPMLTALGEDLDIRTDVPRYRVFRDGACVDEPTDIRSLWRDDLVAFVLGCSFSFEEALVESGLELRHWTTGKGVPMWRTSVECTPAGRFSGPLVVSMRPFKPADAIRAVQVTSRFPAVHGAPVHLGLPEGIGVKDLSQPDWGEPTEIKPDEIPVFWACGVTPQAVVARAKPPFCITHFPGSMVITDRRNAELAAL